MTPIPTFTSSYTVEPDPYYPDYPEIARMYRIVPDPTRKRAVGRPKSYVEEDVFEILAGPPVGYDEDRIVALLDAADERRDTDAWEEYKVAALADAGMRRHREANRTGRLRASRKLIAYQREERRKAEMASRGERPGRQVDYRTLLPADHPKHRAG